MLDRDTKKSIDDLREILVGKLPGPESQVQQITTGLIYKFMYDMDEESVGMGGKPSFFVGDFEKYSWKHLFNTKLSGIDKVKLYSDAIENMYTNPTAPPLFREIFKNSFLPFKDPVTLNKFLKGINEFHYSHSEKLGDAFEYLLSFMGSQGDAGQFRTPRHIIDFITEIVNPQKNETILDPACGTSGFLISSYKHILNQNTDKKLGDKLSAAERKQVGDNLVGYDISPDMTRISLVNMYLHQFTNPQIHEYDTLSSEDRWNEYYDVILANPPFFSPKSGGIQPHSRFGVKSKRAEVLFVDYIMEHLKPNGRAGIVVPEGIIFQTGTAYKTLRKKLVEDCLVGVISLPAGLFQPYSGVKTSILILDKELNQKSDSIFFAKVENDGFSLGAQRTPISNNDLPEILSSIKKQDFNNDIISLVHKADILSEPTVNLSVSRYLQNEISESDFDFITLSEVINFTNGFAFKSSDMFKEATPNSIRVLKIGNITPLGEIDNSKSEFHEWSEKFENVLVGKSDFVVAMTGATVGKVARIIDGTFLLNQRVGCLRPNEKILPNYLKSILLEERFYNYCQLGADGGAQGNISPTGIKEYKFPLPPLTVQQQIVDELESYQKVIDGCRQVIENYKPSINIDPSWEHVRVGEIFKNITDSIKPEEIDFKKTKYVGLEHIEKGKGLFVDNFDGAIDDIKSNKIQFKAGDILYAKLRPNLNKVALVDFEGVCSTDILVLRPKESDLSVFYHSIFLSQTFNKDVIQSITGAQLPRTSFSFISEIKIPRPIIVEQNSICKKITEECSYVSNNKKLLQIFTQKIKDRISKIWGE